MADLQKLQQLLEDSSDPTTLLGLYRDAKEAARPFEELCDAIKQKLGESLPEGQKLKSDVGTASWSKGRARLDAAKWKEATQNDAGLAELETTTGDWQKKLKEAQAAYVTMGKPSLSIRLQ